MRDLEKTAYAAMKKHSLRPIDSPMGDDHHTDAPFTREDEEVAELAYWLGGLFIDVQNQNPDSPYRESYFYKEMTSVDIWKRVARALRIHDLKIVNAVANLRLASDAENQWNRDIPKNNTSGFKDVFW